jgi:hypothetical protein
MQSNTRSVKRGLQFILSLVIRLHRLTGFTVLIESRALPTPPSS